LEQGRVERGGGGGRARTPPLTHMLQVQELKVRVSLLKLPTKCKMGLQTDRYRSGKQA